MAGMLEFNDDIFVNQDVSVMNYKGDAPFKIRRFIAPLLKEKLEISSSHVFPKYLGWDLTDGTFKAKWTANKNFDRWTKFEIQIWCWGEQSDGKTGWLKAKTVSYLKTKYIYANSIQKSMWYTYSLLFYDQQRSKYAERGRKIAVEIWKEIQRKYGMRN
ncbi:MAG: hypothetical protein DRN66_03530 [Candidatus Nanohalarchaeota archaeon]|nr:MAG: hypothetical protein DRN66_03530 [Candidatus Nanohaloarchaeota archaeon]